MKTIASWAFWIIVAIAAWRWMGAPIQDFEDQAACTYQNYEGNCLTQKEYIKMVAHDAAVDALSELSALCNGPSGVSDSRCSGFGRN